MNAEPQMAADNGKGNGKTAKRQRQSDTDQKDLNGETARIPQGQLQVLCERQLQLPRVAIETRNIGSV
jgi:hypothetical protein